MRSSDLHTAAAAVRATLLLFAAVVLNGCGGGGGGGGASPTAPSQQLQLSTSEIGFASASIGGVPPSVQVSGTVSGNPAAIYATITYTNTGLQAVTQPQVSGTTATASVVARPGFQLAPGIYQDTITVTVCPDAACTTQFSGSPATIKVTYVVGLDVQPASITQQVVEGASIPAQALTATDFASAATLTVSTQYKSGNGWLTVPNSSLPLPATVSVSLGSPPPGTYQATLTLNASGGGTTETRTIPVSYTVLSLLQIGAVQAFSVTDQAAASGQTRSVAVTSADNTRNTTWTASPDPASPWLQVTGTTGTTGGNSTLQMSLVATEVAKLRNGHYTAQISVAPGTSGASTVVVPVQLTLDRTSVMTVAPYVEPSGQSGEVILRGAHFDTASIQGIQVGAQTVSSFQIDGPTQIRFTHPALSAGQYPVAVLVNGTASDSTATLVVQDAFSYSAAGAGTVPIQFSQYYEFDAERHSCYAASTTAVAAVTAGTSSWTATTSSVTFTSIFGMALTADGRELLVWDEGQNQIVHLDPATLVETSRTTLTAPTGGNYVDTNLVRLDDGTVAFVTGNYVWDYRPWDHSDFQLIPGPATVQSLQANRTGSALLLNLSSYGTSFSVVDAQTLAQSFSFVGTGADFYASASDRFGSRWVFTPLSSGYPTIITDGTGTTLGQIPAGVDAVSNALSDDGQTLAVLNLGSPNTYESYDLSPVAGGGTATHRGSVAGQFGANDHLSVITPQNEIVTCGELKASAAVLP